MTIKNNSESRGQVAIDREKLIEIQAGLRSIVDDLRAFIDWQWVIHASIIEIDGFTPAQNYTRSQALLEIYLSTWGRNEACRLFNELADWESTFGELL